MNGIRKCSTGKQCFSHPHTQREGVELFERCSDCGYYHRKTESSAVYNSPPVTKETGPLRNKVPAHILQRLIIENKGHSYAIEMDGVYRPIEAVIIDGPTALIKFYDEQNGYGETVVGYNQAVNIEVTAIDVPDLMVGRRNDERLLDDVAKLAGIKPTNHPHQYNETKPVDPNAAELVRNANFGLRCFDYVSAALGMLRSGEWAEQHPTDAILADLDMEISEMVGRANRFEEIKNKYAAAVSTLEYLGYSYRVEGAPMWAPPHGSVPDFILWERGEKLGVPPVTSQVVFDFAGRIGTGKVMGIGQNHIIIEEVIDRDGTEEVYEFCAELGLINIWPYSHADHERAMELVEIMSAVPGQKHRQSGSYYRMAFNLIKSGKI